MRIVFTKRALAGLAALLLLLGACSDPQGTEPGEAGAATGAEEAGESDGSSGDGDSGGGKSKGGPGKGGGSGGSNAGGGANGSPGGGGGGSGGAGGGNSAVGDSGGSSGYLAAGEYVYAQEGFERFCQGPRCSKDQLPETATMTASYSSSSGREAVIVTETESSDQQTITTTTRHTPGQALITKVVIDFSFGSFNYAQTYEPQPPIESLSFPLGAGKVWQGRWKAQTSGDYRMEVTGVDGGIYRIETVTNFRGDFSGRAQATIWVDGDTRAIVRTDGDVAVASAFGEYTSSFRTTLRSAPSR